MRGGSLNDTPLITLFIQNQLPDGTPIDEDNLLKYNGNLPFEDIKTFLIKNINPKSPCLMGNDNILKLAQTLIGMCKSTSDLVNLIKKKICHSEFKLPAS